MKLTTAKKVEGIELPKGKRDYIQFDDDIPGLGLRIREGGSRTWIFQYRIGSKQRRMVLGSAKSAQLNLAEIRKTASRLHGRVELGQDPAMDKETARIEAGNTVGALIHQYLETRKSDWRPRSETEIRRHLTKHSKPLHSMPLAGVSQRNVANLLNDIAKYSGDVTANRVRASLATFLGWVIREGIRLPEGNVAAYTNKRIEKSRDRVLIDAELKQIWKACPDDYYGAVIRLLILTGQRFSEIAALRWDEVHDEQIVLSGDRTKNGRTHVVPLSEAAKSILSNFHRGNRKHLFGRDDTGFQGRSAAKLKLDERIAAGGSAIANWTPHDLRRTAATRMAELGVQPHIVEAVLNHVSGHKGGVAGIYNRATYDKEKREALNLWAEHVMATVEGRKGVVVPMKRA
jgi:integrase